MSEITWRNINAPSLSQELRGLASAGNQITQAFTGGADFVQKLINKNDDIAKQNYLAMVDQAQTPEAMQALLASGKLQSAMQAMSPTAAAAVRGAGDARLGSLYKQGTDAQAFTDQQVAISSRDPLAKFNSAIATGDLAGATGMMQTMEDPTARSAMAKAITEANKQQWEKRRTEKQDVRADSRERRDQETHGQNTVLGNLKIEEFQRTAAENARVAAEAEQGRADKVLVESLVPELNTLRKTNQGFVNEVAAKHGAIIDSDGIPDVSKLDSTAKAKLEAELKEKKLPTLSDAFSDGYYRSKAVDRFKASGASADRINKVLPTIEQSLTTASLPKFGVDAERQTKEFNSKEALLDHKKSLYGTVTLEGQKEDLGDYARGLIEKRQNGSPLRASIDSKALSEWLTKGVEVVDPVTKQTHKVFPSKSDMSDLVGSSREGYGSFLGWGGNIEDILADWETKIRNDPNLANKIANAHEELKLRGAQAIKDSIRQTKEDKKK